MTLKCLRIFCGTLGVSHISVGVGDECCCTNPVSFALEFPSDMLSVERLDPPSPGFFA